MESDPIRVERLGPSEYGWDGWVGGCASSSLLLEWSGRRVWEKDLGEITTL